MKSEYKHQPNILRRRLLIPTDSSGDDSEFDSNMVIILSVLLFALILLLVLNALARCGNRGSQQPAAAGGLKRRALRQLPVVVYGGSGLESWSKECPICLGEFVEGERVRVLPECGHSFHVGCIDTWLISHASCPNCRLSLLENRRIAMNFGRNPPQMP